MEAGIHTVDVLLRRDRGHPVFRLGFRPLWSFLDFHRFQLNQHGLRLGDSVRGRLLQLPRPPILDGSGFYHIFHGSLHAK